MYLDEVLECPVHTFLPRNDVTLIFVATAVGNLLFYSPSVFLLAQPSEI